MSKMMVARLRQVISDMESDHRMKIADLIGHSTYTANKDVGSDKEEQLSEPFEFMKGLDEIVKGVDKVVAAKAALAKFNAETMVSVTLKDGTVKTMPIQTALLYLAELRTLHNNMQRATHFTESKQRRVDGGMNSGAYYQMVHLNFKPEELKAELDVLRNMINDLSAAVDKANTTEIDWE